ncbi:hypothetical protein Taro_008466 [Colocasia esculenta]|uniref:Uncharacterized protein n=1 Tax=Colocasia esculenta TaxID=4460 RepID=A0A843TTR6_COLES|nr:hypothetical protein [Colocasia esculenta]
MAEKGTTTASCKVCRCPPAFPSSGDPHWHCSPRSTLSPLPLSSSSSASPLSLPVPLCGRATKPTTGSSSYSPLVGTPLITPPCLPPSMPSRAIPMPSPPSQALPQPPRPGGPFEKLEQKLAPVSRSGEDGVEREEPPLAAAAAARHRCQPMVVVLRTPLPPPTMEGRSKMLGPTTTTVESS